MTHIPFPDAPGLRGPLPNGCYVRPANGMTSMFYRFDATDAQWYWTPDAGHEFWMPCSTLIVSEGKWKGKKPAYFNVEIIQYLNETRQAPPPGVTPADLATLQTAFQNNPPKPRATDQAKINAALGTTSLQSTTVVRGEHGPLEEILLDASRVGQKDTLVIKDCSGCTIRFTAYCTKVHIDDCKDLVIVFDAGCKVVSQVVELFKCDNVTLEMDTSVKTLQADGCNTITAKWANAEQFHSIVWAGTSALAVTVGDELAPLHTGVDVLRAKNPDLEIRDDITQFITRIVDGVLLSERLIRLANGFPSTEREKKEFDERQDRNMLAFAKNAGITFKRTAIVKEKEQGRNEKCACNSGKKYKVCCGVPNAAVEKAKLNE